MTASVAPEDILALGWHYLDRLVALCSLSEQLAFAASEEAAGAWDALSRERTGHLQALDRLQHGIGRLARAGFELGPETETAWSRCQAEICREAERLAAADAAVRDALRQRYAAAEQRLDLLRSRRGAFVGYADAPRLGVPTPAG